MLVWYPFWTVVVRHKLFLLYNSVISFTCNVDVVVLICIWIVTLHKQCSDLGTHCSSYASLSIVNRCWSKFILLPHSFYFILSIDFSNIAGRIMILFHVFIKFCCICEMLITVLVILAKHDFIINTLILKTLVNCKQSLKSFVRGRLQLF